MLTAMESKVLRLLASGKKTREIAGELVISVKTVETHQLHLKQKLGVSNLYALVATAWRMGLMSEDETR